MDGTKLKGLRIKKGLSLSKLSELTGISKSYLSLIERDIHNNPSLDILEKIARSFEVDVEYFLGRKMENTEILYKVKEPVKTTFKVEIEFSEDQMNPKKLKQIKELVHSLNED